MTTSKLQGKPSEILGEDGWVAYNPEKYLIRGRGVSNNDCCLTLKISVVILLTVSDIILMIFVWRVWYHLILY